MSNPHITLIAIFFISSSLGFAPGVASGPARPTMVKLDGGPLVLADHVARLNQQGPNRLELAHDPQKPPDEVLMARDQFKARHVPRGYRFSEPGPITFWSAVDQLCTATQRRPVLQREPRSQVLLVPASPDRGFVVHDHAFRLAVVSVSYERSGQVHAASSGSAPGENASGQRLSTDPNRFTVRLLITPEPRLKIVNVVGSAIQSAVDDHDRSLLIPDAGRAGPAGATTDVAYYDVGTYLSLRLLYHDQPGKVIRRLIGDVTLKCVELDGTSPTEGTANFEFRDIPMP